VALTDSLTEGPPAAKLGEIAKLLERNNISLDEVGEVKRVSLYQSLTKNEDGEAEVHDLVGIQFSPAWEAGPQWPCIHPGPLHKVPAVQSSSTKTGLSTCVVLPDMQIGYYRDKHGELVPTMDEAAFDVSLSVIKSIKPDLIVLVGDNLDLPEMGKYRLSPSFQLTTQASIDRTSTLNAQLRTAAPQARIVWLAGNHEERMVNYLLDNAKAAFGIKRGNTPDSWPVLSVPYLTHMEEYGIEYLPGYPANVFWINEHIKVIHGDRVKSGGSTAHQYLSNEKVSVLYGHIHRREWAEITREDYHGPRTVLAASPGTLARIDGAVPSTKGGIDLDGRPLTRHENWQQGFAVVHYEEGDGLFNLEMIPIRNGWCMYHGKEYRSSLTPYGTLRID